MSIKTRKYSRETGLADTADVYIFLPSSSILSSIAHYPYCHPYYHSPCHHPYFKHCCSLLINIIPFFITKQSYLFLDSFNIESKALQCKLKREPSVDRRTHKDSMCPLCCVVVGLTFPRRLTQVQNMTHLRNQTNIFEIFGQIHMTNLTYMFDKWGYFYQTEGVLLKTFLFLWCYCLFLVLSLTDFLQKASPLVNIGWKSRNTIY